MSGRRSRQLLRDLEHTAAVHRFVAALNRQAKSLGWDVEQLDPPHRPPATSATTEAPAPCTPTPSEPCAGSDLLRPFFLEYERRAVRPATMAQRLAPYLRYYSSHRPADDHGHRPLVLVVFDDPVAPAHFLEVARREMLRVRVPLPLLASHRELVEAGGTVGQPPGWRPAATSSRLNPCTATSETPLQRRMTAMRIYYVGESRSRNLSVATALGVDGEHWDAVSEHVLDWRWVMEDEFNVPTGRTLRGADLLSPKGSLPKGLRRRLTTLEEGLDIMMTGLRVLEHASGWRQPGRHRRDQRLPAQFPLPPTPPPRPRRRPGAAPGAGQRLPGRGPPLRFLRRGRGGAGRPARPGGRSRSPRPRPGRLPLRGGRRLRTDVARDTAVYAPPYRVAGDDELLQLAGLVSYALLQQEDPTAMAEALNFHLAFGILKSVLDRRACPRDPQGVDRL